MKTHLIDEDLFRRLFDHYETIKEKKIDCYFISHRQISELLNELSGHKNIQTEKIGESLERKEIYSVVIGKGKTKVLAWSQMHGDEPTATAAIFDLLNFFTANDSFSDWKENILNKLTFHFIPMLNPDGAEKFQRENSFNIDLNRDAARLQSDESQLLYEYAEKIQPDFGLNLHDQNSYYTAGRTNNPTAVSLLAPPMDYVKSINYAREKSMQVIVEIFNTLSIFAPQKIARYKDDHEPRSFGDNFANKGISTILIESGFYKDDHDKDFVRKLNFIALLAAFQSIAEKNYEKIDYTDYFEIPENNELLFDLLLRNLTLHHNGRNFTVDVGIKRTKKLDAQTKTFFYESKIAEIGDLSFFYGIEEYDFRGYEIIADKLLSVDDDANFRLSRNGITEFEIKNGFLNKYVG